MLQLPFWLERDDAASELEATTRQGHALARELARWLGLPPDSLPVVIDPGEAAMQGGIDTSGVMRNGRGSSGRSNNLPRALVSTYMSLS